MKRSGKPRAAKTLVCKNHVSKTLVALAAFGIIASLAPASAQESFPARPISLIVPALPGGGTDVLARKLAEIAAPLLGQKITIENRAGGGGTLGVTHLVAARPDGYTLAFVWNGPLTTIPHTIVVPYSPESYHPVVSVGVSSYVFCVRKDFPAETARQFIEHLKANPGKFTYGSDGNGGTVQFAAERIFQKSGIRMRGVPFGGASEVARRLLGGQVDIYGGSIKPILASVQSGEVKCPLLSSNEANGTLPQAEGLSAIGLADAETMLWWGLIAPAGVPDDTLAKLETSFAAAAQTPAFKAFLVAQGVQPRVLAGTPLADAVRAEMHALGEIAQTLNTQRKAH